MARGKLELFDCGKNVCLDDGLVGVTDSPINEVGVSSGDNQVCHPWSKSSMV